MQNLNKKIDKSTKKISALSVSQILTSLLVMFQSMILVRVLSPNSFGTFSQSILVLNILYAVIGLGLAKSILYFNSSTNLIKDRKLKIDNIFTLMIIIGFVSLGALLIFQNTIIHFFNNKLLYIMIPIIGIRTALLLLNQGYVEYLIANEYSSVVAIRNIMVSLITLLVLFVTTRFTNNIYIIFGLLALMDILQCIYFNILISKRIGKISYNSFNIKVVNDIFSYSIPLWFTGISSMLLVYIDKIIIGKLYNIEQFAIYTVASRPIPITFISSSIAMIIMPRLISYYNNKEFEQLLKKWASSIELSFIINSILGFAVIMVSKDIMVFLYTSQYSGGVNVFIVFTINSMLLLTNFGTVLLASKKTKTIFMYAILALILNLLLNVVFYFIFGFIGPAIATAIATFFVASIQLVHSSKILRCSIKQIIYIKNMLIEFIVICILFICFMGFNHFIYIRFGISGLIKIILSILFFGLTNTLFLGKRIRNLLKELN